MPIRLPAVLLALVLVPAADDKPLSPAEAAKKVNEKVTVEMEVKSTGGKTAASSTRRRTSRTTRTSERIPAMSCLPSPRSSLRLLTCLCLVWLCALAGCSPRHVTVRGKATVDGKPLTQGVIKFVRDKDNSPKIVAVADIDSEGNYELLIPEKEGDGLGWYKVCVAFDKKSMKGAPLPVHAKYLKPTETPLSVEVVGNPQPGAYDLKFTEK
jgi:hypothetical protein